MKISNNKNILSGESVKRFCEKVKSLISSKSTLITKNKSTDLKTFEKSYLLFPNSPSSVMFIRKELPIVLVDNDIDTDRTFNAI